MAYPRFCKYCGQSIVMSQLAPGRWQPWEPDDSGRHQCGSGYTGGLTTIDSIASAVGKSSAQTYMTKCPFHCGQQVFYHTSGNGDSVYFDSIGWPWEIHGCWAKYWKEEQARRRVAQYLGNVLNQDRIQQTILVGVVADLFKRTGRKSLTESEVAKAMKLSIEKLRTLYGHMYYLSKNKFVLLQGNVESKNLDGKELQKLMLRRRIEWGVSSIPDLKFGEFGIYGASEEEIATCLGYSTSEFRARYGHIYAATSNGIRFKSKLDEIDKKKKTKKRIQREMTCQNIKTPSLRL